jgi:phage terminase large subunit
MRWKVILLALNNPGIQILLLRRTLPELRENHLIPLQKILNTNSKDKSKHIAEYKEVTKEFIFPNGSRIKLGYCDNENDVLQYQGQAYEVICMEEATHFTEFQFNTLTESNRPSGLMVNPFKPRMYFTCNPGGCGMQWFKRLFISRQYRGQEREEDYSFIQSLVYDNEWMMKNDPDYVRMLENLPEERKQMMLYGNWDIYEGQFFDEFDPEVHVCRPQALPRRYKLYRALDYGLDMLAVLFITIDEDGNIKLIQEIHEPNLVVSEAAERIKTVTKAMGFEEKDVELTLAPGDLWNRQTQTGRSAADLFYDNGIILTEASRDRVNGWLCVKELLRVYDTRDEITGNPKKISKIQIFDVCKNLIAHIPLAQYDDKKINDMSTEPHIITHILDALRYFCIYWVNKPDKPQLGKVKKFKWTQDMLDDYYKGSDTVRRRMVELYGEIN